MHYNEDSWNLNETELRAVYPAETKDYIFKFIEVVNKGYTIVEDKELDQKVKMPMLECRYLLQEYNKETESFRDISHFNSEEPLSVGFTNFFNEAKEMVKKLCSKK